MPSPLQVASGIAWQPRLRCWTRTPQQQQLRSLKRSLLLSPGLGHVGHATAG